MRAETPRCSVVISAGESGRFPRWLQGSEESEPAFVKEPSGTVVFDGVLYNREALSGLTETAALASNDAKIILDTYLRLGEEGLHKIRGIFALMLWDSRSHTLFCARDPVGVYPLFYAEAEPELLLSTSIEALLRHPRVSRTVNRAALADHLCHRWPKPDETYFEAVRRVPPGHVLRIANGNRQVYRYWDPAPPGSPIEWIGAGGLEQFDDRLTQAVNACLEMGPAGIYLSGGLDSVSVAAVAAHESRRRERAVPWALSLAFPHPECNEEALPKSVAAALGLPQVLVSWDQAIGPKGLLRSALEMSNRWPAPLMNFWLPAYHHLAVEGKRRGCQVILTGGGGDEWLWVSPFYAADLIRDLDLVGLYRLMVTTQRSFQLPTATVMRTLLWRYGARARLAATVRRFLRHAAPAALRARQHRNLSRSTPEWVAPDPGLRPELDRRGEQSRPEPGSEGFYVNDMRLALDHSLLTMEKEELFEFGKRVGLRMLMPYWDADLVDLLYRMPPQQLITGDHSKALVRQSLARRFPQLGFEHQKKVVVTTQPRRGTRDTKGKRMEMSLMKPAKLTLVRPLSALAVRFVPFCGYA